jgi:hypothetical protein
VRTSPSRASCAAKYQREVAAGDQRTSLPQRVWEIRVDSVLTLDRAAKRESNEEVPR